MVRIAVAGLALVAAVSLSRENPSPALRRFHAVVDAWYRSHSSRAWSSPSMRFTRSIEIHRRAKEAERARQEAAVLKKFRDQYKQ